jgi:hypothetical protein
MLERMMKPTLFLLLVPIALSGIVSCGDAAKSARGFRLPDGDIDKGREAFVALGCRRCHSVKGVLLEEFAGDPPILLELGGEVIRVKNYGELVTSIINPDHIVSGKYLNEIPNEERPEAKLDSPMPSINETMTVAQMIDLVAFLQDHYKRTTPDYDWQYYGY